MGDDSSYQIARLQTVLTEKVSEVKSLKAELGVAKASMVQPEGSRIASLEAALAKATEARVEAERNCNHMKEKYEEGHVELEAGLTMLETMHDERVTYKQAIEEIEAKFQLAAQLETEQRAACAQLRKALAEGGKQGGDAEHDGEEDELVDCKRPGGKAAQLRIANLEKELEACKQALGEQVHDFVRHDAEAALVQAEDVSQLVASISTTLRGDDDGKSVENPDDFIATEMENLAAELQSEDASENKVEWCNRVAHAQTDLMAKIQRRMAFEPAPFAGDSEGLAGSVPQASCRSATRAAAEMLKFMQERLLAECQRNVELERELAQKKADMQRTCSILQSASESLPSDCAASDDVRWCVNKFQVATDMSDELRKALLKAERTQKMYERFLQRAAGGHVGLSAVTRASLEKRKLAAERKIDMMRMFLCVAPPSEASSLKKATGGKDQANPSPNVRRRATTLNILRPGELEKQTADELNPKQPTARRASTCNPALLPAISVSGDCSPPAPSPPVRRHSLRPGQLSHLPGASPGHNNECDKLRRLHEKAHPLGASSAAAPASSRATSANPTYRQKGKA